MFSLLGAIDTSIKTFLSQLTETLGYNGYLALFCGLEFLFVLIFTVKSTFSYEARLKRSLDKVNEWLFTYKKIDENNIVAFNKLIKKGPKRLRYYWQQYILYRDGGPSKFLSEENVISKPLKTSSWAGNIKNLTFITVVMAIISLVFGCASQGSLTSQTLAVGIVLPSCVLLIGFLAVVVLRGRRVLNLDDIYHIYHLFARFLENACQDLTPFIDFNLLFTKKEIEKGNPQLRQYYEDRARKAKEEFENAKASEGEHQEYHFENVGVDGQLLLDRAMKESETYISKRTTTFSQIAQVEAQKDALRRNYENVQMDLQRKIQATKENIQKLIEQQAATTSRIEVGLLRQQQEKEVAKQAGLQKDYDTEEARYKSSRDELDAEIARLQDEKDKALEKAQKGMSNEYQSFLVKLMKSAYTVANKRVSDEKQALIDEKDKTEDELINVQTQLKRLLDENNTLRDRLTKYETVAGSENESGHYDENGNFIYKDGSFHDENGLFHDVDGKVYDSNGNLVSKDENEQEKNARELQEVEDEQINQFGDEDLAEKLIEEISVEEEPAEEPKVEETQAQTLDDDELNSLESGFEEIANAEETEQSNEENSEERSEEPKAEEEIAEIREEPKEEQIEEVTEPAVEEPKEEANAENANENGEEVPQTETSGEENNLISAEQEPATEEQKEEPKTEEKPKRKVGRPRKAKSEEETTPKRKVGRPRKTETEEKPKRKVGRPKKTEEEPKKKVGRPKKTETEEKSTEKKTTAKKSPSKAKKSSTAKKTTSAKKSPSKKKTSAKKTTNAEEATPKRKVGRPRKASQDMSVDELNQLIDKEIDRLNQVKNTVNKQIDQALIEEEQNNENGEIEEILHSAQSLKEKAESSQYSASDLAEINAKLDALMKELNNKK